jgi:anion-transporting  ArsA/GET3 family ATPase
LARNSLSPATVSLFERRFLYVTGKGGVGKTSVSAALAEGARQRGLRVLWAVTEARRAAHLMPTARFAAHPVALDRHLSVVHITPEAALEEYGQLLIKQYVARRALFNNRYVQSFLAAVPGLHQWAVLGKAWYHANEQQSGRHRFDCVVFDAPATGHAFEMLRVPKVVTEVAPGGALRRDAELAWELFQDPKKSGIVLVTLPEELPTNETLELAGRIQRELQLPISALAVNRCLPLVFDAAEREVLFGLPADPGALGPALASGRGRAAREREQLASLERLAPLGLPLLQLPFVRREQAGASSRLLAELTHALAPGWQTTSA